MVSLAQEELAMLIAVIAALVSRMKPAPALIPVVARHRTRRTR